MSDGRHHIDTGFRVTKRLLHERGDGDVVRDITGVVEQAVLSVARVRVERDVGDHAELGKPFLDGAHGSRDEALGMPCGGGVQRLEFRRDHRKQRDGRNAQRHALLGIAQQEVDALARDSRQRWHRLLAVLAVEHEHRIDEVVGGQAVFTHQAP